MADHNDKLSVVDTDPHFTIDVVTRSIISNGDKKYLVQFDHNSERITFECPRYIEGHDMMNCNKVLVNYLDVAVAGVYEVEDLKIKESATDTVCFSWLVSCNSTAVVGALRFAITFSCVQSDGTTTYKWNTGINEDLKIISSISNDATIAIDNVDILEQWKTELFGASDGEISKIEQATNKMLATIPPEYNDLVAKVNTNADNVSELKESKISKPSIDGTVGQVLTKDENGEFVWRDVLTELDDDSVDLSKLKSKYLIVEEGVTGTNVIDESLLIYKMSDDRNLSPGYLSTTVANDTLVPQNGTYTSSFIKVEPNKTYYINREEYKLYEGIKLYNSDKTPIQFIQLKDFEQRYTDKEAVSPQRTFTTPENCSYMRIDANEKYMDIIYVATDYPKKVIYNKNYYLNKSYIKEGSIKTQKIVWSPTPDNTCDGYVYISPNGATGGTITGSNKDQSTGFIIVRPNTRYTKNPKSSGSVNKQDVAFYDYRKTFISGIVLEVGEFEFTTPNNCQYIRFDMLATHKDTEYLEVVYDEDGDDKELVTSVKSLPTLYMSGDVTGMSKVNEKFVRFKYVDGTMIKRGYNTIKWQGDSSLSYPKKNYTIKLYCDKNKKCKQLLDFGWGKQNKYVLKANYIDHSHARNIVSARLWSQIVNSRGTYSYTNVKDTPNNGAIDGMPIIVYLNGTYLGLYTFNIPKDKWMFGMDDGISTQAVVGSENYVEGCFRSSSNPLNGWSAEFPDELPTEIQTSFKTAYNFVVNNTGADFKSGLSNYFDVQSLIDYYIFGYVICHLDGFGKNQLLATYDGIHWSMMAYDMDSTFGLFWNGSKFVSTDYRCQEDYQSVVDGPSGTNGNELFNKLKDNFKAEIYERYTELREDVLSLDNIKFEFEKFMNSITFKEYLNDIKTNTGVPQKTVDHLKQIEEYIEARLPYVDTKMKELNG